MNRFVYTLISRFAIPFDDVVNKDFDGKFDVGCQISDDIDDCEYVVDIENIDPEIDETTDKNDPFQRMTSLQ